MSTDKSTKLAVFNGKHIRKILHDGEWWFSIIDVIEVLVGGDRPRKYWNDLKNKLGAEGYSEVSEKIGQMKMPAHPDSSIMQAQTYFINFRIMSSNFCDR